MVGRRTVLVCCELRLLARALAPRVSLAMQAAIEEVATRAGRGAPSNCSNARPERSGVCPASAQPEGEHAVEHCGAGN